MGFGETIIYVRAQRMQRQLTLQVPLTAGDFRAVEPAANLDLNALGAKPQRFSHRLAHRAPEGYAFFELGGDLFSLQLRIQLRFVNLLNRDQDFATGFYGKITF